MADLPGSLWARLWRLQGAVRDERRLELESASINRDVGVGVCCSELSMRRFNGLTARALNPSPDPVPLPPLKLNPPTAPKSNEQRPPASKANLHSSSRLTSQSNSSLALFRPPEALAASVLLHSSLWSHEFRARASSWRCSVGQLSLSSSLLLLLPPSSSSWVNTYRRLETLLLPLSAPLGYWHESDTCAGLFSHLSASLESKENTFKLLAGKSLAALLTCLPACLRTQPACLGQESGAPSGWTVGRRAQPTATATATRPPAKPARSAAWRPSPNRPAARQNTIGERDKWRQSPAKAAAAERKPRASNQRDRWIRPPLVARPHFRRRRRHCPSAPDPPIVLVWRESAQAHIWRHRRGWPASQHLQKAPPKALKFATNFYCILPTY